MKTRRQMAAWLALGLVLASCGPSAEQRVAEKVVEIDSALRAGDLAAAQLALRDAESIRRADVPSAVRDRVSQRARGQEALRSAESKQRSGEFLAAHDLFQQAMSFDPWFAVVARDGVEATRSAFIERESLRIRDALDAASIEEALEVFADAAEAFPESEVLEALRAEVADAVDGGLVQGIRGLIASGDLAEAQATLRQVVSQLGRTTDLLDELAQDAESAVRLAEEERRIERERVLQERIERDLRQALDTMRRWWTDVHWAAQHVMCDGFDQRPIEEARRWGSMEGVSTEHAVVFFLDACEERMRWKCTHYSFSQLCSGLIDWSRRN